MFIWATADWRLGAEGHGARRSLCFTVLGHRSLSHQPPALHPSAVSVKGCPPGLWAPRTRSCPWFGRCPFKGGRGCHWPTDGASHVSQAAAVGGAGKALSRGAHDQPHSRVPPATGLPVPSEATSSSCPASPDRPNPTLEDPVACHGRSSPPSVRCHRGAH